MTEPKTKATPIGRNAWHGLYWTDGQWVVVRDKSDLPTPYKTPEAAIAAAWYAAP